MEMVLEDDDLGLELDMGLLNENEVSKDGNSMQSFWIPLMMSLIAGLATGVGALFVLMLDRRPKNSQLAFSLALAAGVMLTVSIFDLYIPLMMKDGVGSPTVTFAMGLAAFFGMMRLIPHPDVLPVISPQKERKTNSRQFRVGFAIFCAMTIHNFPEGVAVSLSNIESDSLGLLVTLAIAVHNIPEGIALAFPIYAATGRKRLAIGMAFLSGMSEPLGSFFALTVMDSFFTRTPWLVSYILCFVSGLMTGVSFGELLPEALEFKETRATALGFVVGSLLMIATIFALGE